ncbi:MAG: hypothetical protein AAGI03_00285 [Pseudomonadota bacterium]
MKYVLFLAVLVIAEPALSPMQTSGADTIVVSGTPVRFNGDDAPELGTIAWRDARRCTVNYLAGRSGECDLNDERTHDR